MTEYVSSRLDQFLADAFVDPIVASLPDRELTEHDFAAMLSLGDGYIAHALGVSLT